MYIFGLNLLFLICLLPIANCYVAQSNKINIRDGDSDVDADGDVHVDNSKYPDKNEDIAMLLSEPATIQVKEHPEGVLDPQLLLYRQEEGMIGHHPKKGATLFIVSNYGIWGCYTSPEDTTKSVYQLVEDLYWKLVPSEYNTRFGEGCLAGMKDQLESWKKENKEYGGPEVKVPAAYIFVPWTMQKAGARVVKAHPWLPARYPFLAKAGKDVAAALRDYGGPTYVPVVGKHTQQRDIKKGVVIRHAHLNIKKEKAVQVFESSQAQNREERTNGPILEVAFWTPYQRLPNPDVLRDDPALQGNPGKRPDVGCSPSSWEEKWHKVERLEDIDPLSLLAFEDSTKLDVLGFKDAARPLLSVEEIANPHLYLSPGEAAGPRLSPEEEDLQTLIEKWSKEIATLYRPTAEELEEVIGNLNAGQDCEQSPTSQDLTEAVHGQAGELSTLLSPKSADAKQPDAEEIAAILGDWMEKEHQRQGLL